MTAGLGKLIRRPRLLRRMDTSQALTVVWGPAGSGKTALIESWLATQPDATVIRVQAPLAGSSPAEYWARVRHVIGAAAVLVLDLPDQVADPDAWARLVAVCESAPGLRVIVAVRDPSMFWDAALPPDAVLVPPAELQFTAGEIVDLFDAAALDLAERASLDVHRRTGGHAALADLALRVGRLFGADFEFERERADAALDRLIDRYVDQQLLDAPTVRPSRKIVGMLACAWRLTEERAAAMAGSDAVAALPVLERAGLLERMPATNGYDWRFPAGIRQSVVRLAEREDDSRLRAATARLARVSAARGEHAAALWYATEGRDWELAVAVLESRWLEILVSHTGVMRRALTTMPEEILARRPALSGARELFLRFGSHAVQGPTTLVSSAAELASIADEYSPEEALLAGTARSVLQRITGDYVGAVDLHESLGVLAARSLSTPGTPAVNPELPVLKFQWGLASQLCGDHPSAAELFRQAYSGGRHEGVDFVARNAAGQLALHYSLLGEPAVADRWIRKESEFGDQPGWLGSMVRIPAITARALSALDRMDLEGAQAALRDLDDTARGSAHGGGVGETVELWSVVAYTRSQVDLLRQEAGAGLDRLSRAASVHRRRLTPGSLADVLLGSASMDLRSAMGAAAKVRERASHAGGQPHPLVQLSSARAALMSGSPNAALAECRILTDQCGGYTRVKVEALLIEAMALIEIGDAEPVRRAWNRAVALSEDSGLIRSFVSVPPDLLAVLSDLGSPLPEGWVSLDPARRPHVFPAPVVAVALTEREAAVLVALAGGATVTGIAESLFVSSNTVKSQLQSLYRKLDVHSRAEAVEIARRRGLL